MDTEELLKQSTEVAQTAATSIGGTFSPGTADSLGGFTPGVITGETFNPVVPLNITEAHEVPIPDVSQVTGYEAPGVTETPDWTTQLEGLTAELGGKETAIATATGQATASSQQELIELNKRLKLQQAQAIADQEKALAQGETLGFATGEAARVATRNTVETLRLSALIEAKQGNITFAKKQATDAVNAEYAQKESDIAIARKNLINNYDSFTAAEKKRADIALATLDADDAFVLRQKEDRKGIYDLGLLAQQNGAPSEVVQEAFNANSPEEALMAIKDYMQSPQAKIDLQNALLQTQLTKLNIQKTQSELEIFKKYGGLTPTQWAAQQADEEEALKEASETFDAAKAEVREITKDITQIDAILNSKALDSVVGGNIFARGVSRQKNWFYGTVAKVGTLGISGTVAEISGLADDTVALTEQILSQKFLDKLITSKGEGATFGQLSDREGNALRAAATAISQTAIRIGSGDKEKVIGYDMSEKMFKEQMQIIKNSLQFAYEDIEGDILGEEDPIMMILDAAYDESLTFSPSGW